VIDRPFPGQIRVIDENGEQMGIMEIRDALQVAEDRGLDLIEIAPNEVPPTCKLLEYGKYKYQQKKKTHKQKKPVHRRKEIKLRPKTDEHDFMVKLNHGRRILEKGHKVQVTMVFRGREAVHLNLGRALLLRFAESLVDISKIESAPAQEGRNRMNMVLTRK
jgi:translation initiation factor IF-3